MTWSQSSARDLTGRRDPYSSGLLLVSERSLSSITVRLIEEELGQLIYNRTCCLVMISSSQV